VSGSWPWHGRSDTGEGPDALRWHQVVRRHEPGTPAGIALLGFACDEGVRRNQGRTGAAEGPAALRRALANLAWHGGPPLWDAGDIVCEARDLEGAQDRLGGQVAGLLGEGHLPIVLGGGHETAWGSFQGLVAARPDHRIGVLNLDAHLDLRRDSRATSGTAFAQMALLCERVRVPFDYLCVGVAEPANTAALFATARRLGVRCWLDEEVSEAALPRLLAEIESFAAKLDAIHLSIDLDVLPASVMPAVSAPAARGIALAHVEAVIAAVRATGKLALAEIVELSPTYDQDGRGARTAARLAWLLARSFP
jgi:formiminoglutamase